MGTRVPKRIDNGAPKAGSVANSLHIDAPPGADQAALLAKTATRPSVRAALTMQAYSRQFVGLDLNALTDQLVGQIAAVNGGNMKRAEGMLLTQAQTLEAIFHELARRAALNMGEYLGAAETYLRLGLKAQSQCRATLETLAAIKNPAPLTFVKQANIAHGPQQVNNGPQTAEASRARESESPPNKLLEQPYGERLDRRTVQAAVGVDPAMATLEEVHGPKNARR